MTKNIFDMKKELILLETKLNFIKDKIFKNNLIIYSIFSLIFISTIIFNFNFYSLFINGSISFILSNITSLLVNKKEYKKKKELNNNINYKQNELNNLIQKEIEKDKEINYVNDINKKLELNSLDEFVMNNKLRKDYIYNLKKVKKRVRKR